MRARLPQIDPVVGRLSLVHLLVDAYGNVYAPLVPLLIPRLHLSLLAAGTLAMLFQLAASVAQLGFGYLADRWRPRLLVTAGPVVAVGLLSLAGLASSAAMLALVLVAGGLGTAAFHPSAAALVHRLGGPRTGLAMSIYITGGTLGFSFAPLVFAPLAERFGPASTAILAPPGLAAVLLLLRRLPEVETTADPRAGGLRILVPYARPLALLYLIVVLRTLTSIGFTVFVPVLLTARGLSAAEAGSVVALFLFASGIGGFFGGPAADRWGPRTVIIASLVAAAPLLFLAPRLEGVWFALALAAGGFALQSTLP
ncbi:MAG TPA: MFS transporter, partial [Vicinamibacterales bacterium]|nr:MFS transporter [Vicinamibacterales bacterium]